MGAALALVLAAFCLGTFANLPGAASSRLSALELPASTWPSASLAYGSTAALSHPDFFEETRATFLSEEVTFIEANLSTMELTYYEQGTPVLTVDILSKGREGSWWETPAGLYKIEQKKENHFSSFGEVYQPWSMVFQGNFFIHGWPYYPDGTPVESAYSGGCIRLADEDAEALFTWVAVGTPVLVFESDFKSDGFGYEPVLPELSASAFLVADVASRAALVERHAEESRPIASITKLVTALVAAEYINLDKNIFITEAMLVPTVVSRLTPGTAESAYGLLFPLLRESSNEAAEAFAHHVGREWFIALMNKKAESLGMVTAHFTDPSGLDEGNVASPHDLFRLTQYLYNNRSFILRISAGKDVASAYAPPTHRDLLNFNMTDEGDAAYLGGKIGETNASRQTDVALFETTVGGEVRIIAFILLGSEDHMADRKKLKGYLTERYGIAFE
jgi:D-alanyl-D-alanine carboxypeptidase